MALVGKKTFCVVTGASRGIGREIAVQLAENSAPESSFLLLATNTQKLEETASVVKAKNEKANVEILAVDFSKQTEKLSGVEEAFKKLWNASPSVDLFVVVHCAGTVGNMALHSYELDDTADWQAHLLTNVSAMIQLNCVLHKLLKGKGKEKPIFVNITSLLAIQAFPSFTQYSTSKAAREAYFRAFASEEPAARVLSYSPGPVLTDMHTTVIGTTCDDGVRSMFKEQGDANSPQERRALTTDQTVKKMIGFLNQDTYTSGSRIDYFDM
ncbi:hypothetical protein QR680_012068 [Steinernema hermaphroditum]|uniref:Sepiapterin reductase n=1 Tax=Steinernema hermaphroditum TaxID=289476 RepID=A0AA39M047_9BILA|nr:hypothetical protein QR680_012068 [Steinernema hermaphroditum]